MFDKKINSFIRDLQYNNPNINEEEIEKLLLPLKKKIIGNLSLDEMVSKIIDDFSFGKYISNSPGFMFNFKTNNINIKLYGGYRNFNYKLMKDDTLFDLDSITKQYTMIIIYKLIKLKIISFTTKVRDILDYPNIGNLTILELTYFVSSFDTYKNIEDAKSKEEALSILKNVHIKNVGDYNYNDIGCIILKEIAEKVTGVSYENLLQNLVLDELNLKSTFVSIPNLLRNNITGTPNIDTCLPNDAKACILGGFSGHAGIFATCDDVVSMTSNVINNNLIDGYDFYTPGISLEHSMAGNACCFGNHNVDKRFPKKSFALKGATRVQVNTSMWELDRKYTLTSAIFLNPATISKEDAISKENTINSYLPDDKKIKLYREFNTLDGNFKQIDARYLIPNNVIISLNKEVSDFMLKLLYIEYFMSKYEKNRDFNYKIKKILTRNSKNSI